MLLLLKIPLFYLGGVIWYAIKAEPSVDEAPGDATPVREPLTPRPWVGGRERLARRIPFGPARRPVGPRAPDTRLGART